MAGSFASISVSSVKLDTHILDQITVTMRPKASAIVQKFGMAMASDAAQMAPVDTSALRNSILSESHAQDDLTFVIQDGVEYGVYQEFGTSRMAAQPFMVPAIEKNSAAYLEAFRTLFP